MMFRRKIGRIKSSITISPKIIFLSMIWMYSHMVQQSAFHGYLFYKTLRDFQ